MHLSRPQARNRGENTVALINIVFLMLIFFLIAGTLAPPLDRDVALISTRDAKQAEPPDALSVTADGLTKAGGEETTVEAWMAGRIALEGEAPGVRLAADRNLAAERLVDIVARLRASGAGTIRIVTERQ